MKKLSRISVICLCIITFTAAFSFAEDKGNFSVSPKTNNGKKWRIGYYEGGEYIDYQKCLAATIRGLMDLGWVEKVKIPQQNGEQTKDLWNWMVNNLQSSYIQFLNDAHYSANWDKNLREEMVSKIIDRLNNKKDIDLMLALGTWAGQDLANEKHHTPIISMSVSDPLKAGIIKSIEDSGLDHVHARVDPYRFERQVMIFHDIIGFQKLGIAYTDTVAGKTYAALDKVEKVAQERGFEIVPCFTTDESADKKADEESVKKCFNELCEKVDAIYVTRQNGVNQDSLPELVKIVNANKIPTFSQSGSGEVKAGFLMSISKASFKFVGLFWAETIAKVFNGAKPRQIDQVFENPPKIAINLKAAEIIGYDPPVDVLGAADEIFQEISSP